jgi:hypothetical protein
VNALTYGVRNILGMGLLLSGVVAIIVARKVLGNDE